MARLSLYLVALAVTALYVGMLHDEAHWLAGVRSEAIQAENIRVHQATQKHPNIWSQVHPTTYADLCRAFVHYGVLDQTSADILIHADAIRAVGVRMTITYPSGTAPVITGQADTHPAVTTTIEL